MHRSLPTGEMAMASSIAPYRPRRVFLRDHLVDGLRKHHLLAKRHGDGALHRALQAGDGAGDTEGMPGAALTAMRYDTYGSSVRVICVPHARRFAHEVRQRDLRGGRYRQFADVDLQRARAAVDHPGR